MGLHLSARVPLDQAGRRPTTSVEWDSQFIVPCEDGKRLAREGARTKEHDCHIGHILDHLCPVDIDSCSPGCTLELQRCRKKCSPIVNDITRGHVYLHGVPAGLFDHRRTPHDSDDSIEGPDIVGCSTTADRAESGQQLRSERLRDVAAGGGRDERARGELAKVRRQGHVGASWFELRKPKPENFQQLARWLEYKDPTSCPKLYHSMRDRRDADDGTTVRSSELPQASDRFTRADDRCHNGVLRQYIRESSGMGPPTGVLISQLADRSEMGLFTDLSTAM